MSLQVPVTRASDFCSRNRNLRAPFEFQAMAVQLRVDEMSRKRTRGKGNEPERL